MIKKSTAYAALAYTLAAAAALMTGISACEGTLNEFDPAFMLTAAGAVAMFLKTYRSDGADPSDLTKNN